MAEGAAGPEGLAKEFCKRQADARIILAHHGAENLNPYGNQETASGAFNEGCLAVSPSGHLHFFVGAARIRDRLEQLAERGYKIPLSQAWHDELQKVDPRSPFPENFILVNPTLERGSVAESAAEALSLTRRDTASRIRYRQSVAPHSGRLPETGIAELLLGELLEEVEEDTTNESGSGRGSFTSSAYRADCDPSGSADSASLDSRSSTPEALLAAPLEFSLPDPIEFEAGPPPCSFVFSKTTTNPLYQAPSVQLDHVCRRVKKITSPEDVAAWTDFINGYFKKDFESMSYQTLKDKDEATEVLEKLQTWLKENDADSATLLPLKGGPGSLPLELG